MKVNCTSPHGRQGFTLLEIVLVIAMVSVLLGITVVVAGNLDWREDVDEAADLIEAAFTETLLLSQESMEDRVVTLQPNGVLVRDQPLDAGESVEHLAPFPGSVKLEWLGQSLGSDEALQVRVSATSLLRVPELKLVGAGRVQLGTTDPVSGGISWR